MSGQFKRGELRSLSTALIEGYWKKHPALTKSETSLDDLAHLHMKEFGFDLPTARTHVRWQIREGLVKDGELLAQSFPKKSPKFVVAGEVTKKEPAPAKSAPRLVHDNKTKVKKAKTPAQAPVEQPRRRKAA